MLKILNVFVLLNISFFLFSNEIPKKNEPTDNGTKINFSISAYSSNNNNLNINLFALKDKTRIKPGPNTILLRIGIGLLSAGTTSLLLGGTLIGVSHLFAWYFIVDLLNDTNFVVINWVVLWKIIFFTYGYDYSTQAALLMIFGNVLCGIGSILIPGIVFMVYALIQLKKEKQKKMYEMEISYKIEPLSDAIGLSIKF
ncbi:MAG: hypothetical protein JXB50_00330 [Spirochaetes bacterium]|nr:hypothetical protein [Spirochaetota bacterium]